MTDFERNRNLTEHLPLFLLALAACFSLAISQAPAAFAETLSNAAYVTSSDGTTFNFKTADEAWAFVNNNSGSKMYLLKDWTTSNVLTLNSGVTAELELSGNMINRNAVDTNKTEYASDSDHSGSVFLLEESAELTITSDVSSTQHNGDVMSSGRFWHYNKNGKTTIYGGLITGGATDSNGGGGGIALKEKAKLVMSNVTVAGNIADSYGILAAYGWGGAIALAGESSEAKLTDCSLMYNYAQSGGGAVNLGAESSSLKMTGGSISNNYTSDYGGGLSVRLASGDEVTVSLSDTEISNNHAEKCGGGIFLGGIAVTIEGGKITGNSAVDGGGGIYVKQGDCGIDGCTITNNIAGKKGGGVLVENGSSSDRAILTIGGTLTIKDNKVDNSKSNLYVCNSTPDNCKPGKINGQPSMSSEVWVSADEDGVISSSTGTFNVSVFRTDDSSKTVYWETDSSKDHHRYLKIGENSGSGDSTGYTATAVELAASETSTGMGNLQETSYSYNGYPVYMGYGMQDKTDMLSAYYYSDGYFMESAENYNEHLASFAFRLECSAMNSSVFTDSRGNARNYSLQASHAKQMLSDIGVAEDDIFLSSTYFEKPTADSIACTIGSKTLKNADGTDSDITLVMISVRGQGYESEWASNVTLGGSSESEENAEHAGFAQAADTIQTSWLEPYMAERGLDVAAKQGKVRFLVTGFSRGGAVANLLSKRLVDSYEDPSFVNDNHVVFGYTFEAPQGGNYSCTADDRSYVGIHNAILSGDLVPFVAMSSMNFQRYGVDHYLGGSAAGTASADVIEGEGAESEGQAKRYSRPYAGYLSHSIQLDSDGKLVVDSNDWKSTHFMKDNDYYEVGSAEYEEQKSIMLQQLAATNGSVLYDDYFHTATLTLNSQSDGSHVREVGVYGNVSLADYLHDLMFYGNAWLISTKSLQLRSARLNYTNDFQGGDGSASDENTARTLLAAAFSGTMDTEKALSGITDNVGSIVWDLFSGKYVGNSISDFLKSLRKYGVFGDDSIPLTDNQVGTLSDMLTNVLAGDFADVGDYFAGTTVDYGVDYECYVMLGTLLYNVNNIMLNHNIDVVYAWLRSADSYYTSDETISTTRYAVASATSDEVSKPYLTMEVNGQEVRVNAGESCNLFDYDSEEQPTVTNIQLHTEDSNAGGMVFYVEGDASGVAYKDYRYFDASKTTLFADVTDWSEAQRLTAHAVWYNTPSNDTTFTIYYEKTAEYHSVYVNDELFGTFKEGDTVTVPIQPEDENHEYNGIELEKVPASAPDGSWWKVSDDTSKLEFTMPGGDVSWKISYKQKTVQDPVASPDVESFETDQFIDLSTPSGTEDDGFTVTCSYTAYTSDKLTDRVEISGTGENGIMIYAIDGRESVWKITATATHDGWADSATKEFIFRVTPVEKTYTVTVLNGTLTEDGKATDEVTGTFKAGDTVTVTASKKKVAGWESDPAGLVKSDCTDRTVSFTMPSSNVDIVALLEDELVDKPTASIESGEHAGTQTVELTCATEGATIRFTTDGSEPDENSPVYEGPVEVAHNMTIKAKAFYEGMKDSETAEFTYTISHTVTFVGATGSSIGTQTVVDGACATQPDDPTLEGFTFKGWFLEDGTAYDFSTSVTSDLVLYAKWSGSGEPDKGEDGGDQDTDGDEDAGSDQGAGDGHDIDNDQGTDSKDNTHDAGEKLPASGDDSALANALLAVGTISLGSAAFLRRRKS